MLIIIMAVTEGLVREEQLLHDMCILSAMIMEITQILTRAGGYITYYISSMPLDSISEPLLR
jgi:hypothetical protein